MLVHVEKCDTRFDYAVSKLIVDLDDFVHLVDIENNAPRGARSRSAVSIPQPAKSESAI